MNNSYVCIYILYVDMSILWLPVFIIYSRWPFNDRCFNIRGRHSKITKVTFDKKTKVMLKFDNRPYCLVTECIVCNQ